MIVIMDRIVGPESINRECQQRLARTLLSSCGYEEALELCRTNHWEGVLQALSRVRPSAAPPTEH